MSRPSPEKVILLVNLLIFGVLRVTSYAISGLASLAFWKIIEGEIPGILITATFLCISFLSNTLGKSIYQKKYSYTADTKTLKLKQEVEIFTVASLINVLLLIGLTLASSFTIGQSLRTVIPIISYIIILSAGFFLFFLGLVLILTVIYRKQAIKARKKDRVFVSLWLLFFGVGFLTLSGLALISGLISTRELLF